MFVPLAVSCALYIQYVERVFVHFKMPSVVCSFIILILHVLGYVFLTKYRYLYRTCLGYTILILFFLTGIIVTCIAILSSYLVISKRDKVTGIKELDMCPRLNLQDTLKYLQCSCKFYGCCFSWL